MLLHWQGDPAHPDHEVSVELEGLLSEQLSTKVRVQMGAKRGRVVIDFANLEDLERIYRVISD